MPELDQRQADGKLGESLACDELRRRGYAILATRYRSRFGEIDIVASRDGVIGFVEVKARRSSGSIDAVSSRKRRKIAAMALDYLAWTRQLDAPCRFIVIAINRLGTDRMTVTVVEDAWEVDG